MKKFDVSMKEISRSARQQRIEALVEEHSKTAENPAELLEKSLDDWVQSFVKVLPEHALLELRGGKDDKETVAYVNKLMSLLDVPAEEVSKYWDKLREVVAPKQE
jgi:glutamate synthase domain-containing protein 3